jgi:hypothetical protein
LDEFKSGELHEKRVELKNNLSICLKTEENLENMVDFQVLTAMI